MGAVAGGVATYLLYGAWLAWRLPWVDGEYSGLPAGAARWQAHRAREARDLAVLGRVVGGVTRLQYRMPGSYWLYAWARWVPAAWQRPLGRGQSLLISAAGVSLALTWAEALGGPRAVALACLLLGSSASLVGAYVTASYEGTVAALWLAGCYAVWHGAPELGALAGVGLALLRPLAWPQAAGLWLLAGPLWMGAATVLGVGLVAMGARGPVGRVCQAGRQALARVPPGPETTWAYAGRRLVQRYEPWLGWLGLALAAGMPGPLALRLLGLSAVALAAGPGLLAWWRPKWIVGYLPDLALPVIVALAAHMATLPAGWPEVAAGVCLGWGLARPRHAALSGDPFR